nr:30S ribosomal protein S9 [Candidatus Sigynarchaeota archaeon]
MSKKKVYLETGKRKTSIAKATLKQEGHGRILINHVPYTIIPELIFREQIQEVIDLIGPENLKDVDIEVNVVGGGRMSQISAARTSIARAFTDYKKSSMLRAKLVNYDRTLLSGDARHTEAKKFGGHSARARKQKSYR